MRFEYPTQYLLSGADAIKQEQSDTIKGFPRKKEIKLEFGLNGHDSHEGGQIPDNRIQ